MREIKIIGIKVADRIKESGRTQQLLSKYNSIIRTRLGFHELNEAVCSRIGYIIIELKQDQEQVKGFEQELSEIGGLIVRKICFPNTSTQDTPVVYNKNDIRIIAILTKSGSNEVEQIQYIFTKYGNIIKTRMGIHPENNEKAVILLELHGDAAEMESLENELKKLSEMEFQRIVF